MTDVVDDLDRSTGRDKVEFLEYVIYLYKYTVFEYVSICVWVYSYYLYRFPISLIKNDDLNRR